MKDDLRRHGPAADVLEPLEVQLLLDGRQRTESREEVARRHYWIAAMTQREGLEVDWEFVALRMAQALLGVPEGNDQADQYFPVGAEQGAPRLRRGEDR